MVPEAVGENVRSTGSGLHSTVMLLTNLALTGAVFYLFSLYGTFHWWFAHLLKATDGVPMEIRRDYTNRLFQLHVLLAFFSFLTALIGVTVLRTPGGNRLLKILNCTLGIIAFLLCSFAIV